MESLENSVTIPVYSYDVTFPPGAHGLELQPVIISSERSIGCKVKGFYFGLEHEVLRSFAFIMTK
jgi:hypothetical protein